MISSVRLGCVDADSSLQLLSLLTTCLTIFYGIGADTGADTTDTIVMPPNQY
jgi:hypothetical protein